MVTVSYYIDGTQSTKNKAKKITIGGKSLYYSYETLVAIEDEQGLSVIQNQ